MSKLRFFIVIIILIPVLAAQTKNSALPVSDSKSPNEQIQALLEHSEKIFPASSQQALNDTRMAIQIAESINDPKRLADALYGHGFLYFRAGNMDSSQIFLSKALALRRAIQDSVGIAEALNRLGNVSTRNSDESKALKLHEEALAYLDGHENYKETGRVLNNMANIYRNWGNYDHALDLYTETLRNYQKADFKEGLAWLNFSLTMFYKKLGNYENALASVQKSLEIYSLLEIEKRDSTGIMLCYGQLGDVHLKLGNYQNGLAYHLAALKLRRKTGVEMAISDGLSGVGRAYYYLGRYDEAIANIRESMKIQKEAASESLLATNLKSLGQIYHAKKNTELALDYLYQGLFVAETHEHYLTKKEILKELSDIYAEQGNYSKTFGYQKQYMALTDSIFTSEVSNRTASMQVMYEIKEKEHDNERLEQANRISKLEIERSHSVRNFLILAVLVFISAIALVIFLYLRKIKANRILKLKNDEIEKSHVLLEQEIDERRIIEKEREKLIVDLQDSLKKIKTLSGLVPICANCKNIRNDQGYYEKLEHFIMNHSDVVFSHGICPDCAAELYPEFVGKED